MVYLGSCLLLYSPFWFSGNNTGPVLVMVYGDDHAFGFFLAQRLSAWVMHIIINIHFWETRLRINSCWCRSFKAVLSVCRREPSGCCVQREVGLQPEGSGAHAATEGGGGKWLIPCQQQVRPQPYTFARLWNHPASPSPHWPGGVLWPAGEQLRALCYPSALRGGGVWAGLSLCLSLSNVQSVRNTNLLLNIPQRRMNPKCHYCHIASEAHSQSRTRHFKEKFSWLSKINLPITSI